MFTVSEPLVYIVIVNWNRWQETIECLESIFHSTYSNYRVIVCDNGSTDCSLTYIKKWATGDLHQVGSTHDLVNTSPQPSTYSKPIPLLELQASEVEATANDTSHTLEKLLLIQLPDNWGFGRANNVALRYIKLRRDADYIWLLNNDTVILLNTLSAMVKAACKHTGITGSILKFYDNPSVIQAYGGGYFNSFTGRITVEQSIKPKRLDFINGASLLLSRGVLEKVGFFDEQIFMYFEENDYCIRAQQHGFNMAVADAIVLHKGGVSSGSKSTYFAWKSVYLNKWYVMRKHYRLGIWSIFAIAAWAINVISLGKLDSKRQASLDALRFALQDIFKY